MNYNISLLQLVDLLKTERMTHPAIGPQERECLGGWAELLDRVGLPSHFGDSFSAVAQANFFDSPDGCTNKYAQTQIPMRRAIVIGRSEFGSYVVDCDNGFLVYVDSSGVTQFVNSSIEGFLFIFGRFQQSSKAGFCDIERTLADCKRIDPGAFADPDGMWSVVFEEANAGIYGRTKKTQ